MFVDPVNLPSIAPLFLKRVSCQKAPLKSQKSDDNPPWCEIRPCSCPQVLGNNGVLCLVCWKGKGLKEHEELSPLEPRG